MFITDALYTTSNLAKQDSMDQLFSSFELAELLIGVTEQMDSLFNYWMSASFAVVISVYIGRDHFNLPISLSVGVLYFMASVMFVARYYAMSTLIVQYTELAGSSLPSQFLAISPVIGIIRAVTFTLGFLMIELYLGHSYLTNKK